MSRYRCFNCTMYLEAHTAEESCLFAPTKFRAMTVDEYAKYMGWPGELPPKKRAEALVAMDNRYDNPHR